MTSKAHRNFWACYRRLPPDVQRLASRKHRMWRSDPFHPSLHFKCINREEDIWSVRITLAHRAIGILQGDTVTWFWIGSHDVYKRFFS